MRGLTIILIFCGVVAKAQLAVYDPANNAQLLKSYMESEKQTAQLIAQTKQIKEQVNVVKQTAEYINKVNTKLKTVYYLNQIEQTVTNTIKQSNKSFEYLKESGEFSADELSIIMGNFTRLVVATNNVISLSNVIVNTVDLKMNDFERIERLDKAYTDVLGLNMEVKSLNTKYVYIMQQRQMQRAFKR
mgnify:CR=1 FL=1